MSTRMTACNELIRFLVLQLAETAMGILCNRLMSALAYTARTR